MSAFEDIRELPSFRRAREEVIPREVMGKILEAGRHAPSPGNVQSLEFIVVEDDTKKEKLYRATDDERVEQAPTAVIVVSDIERLGRRLGEGAERQAYSESATAVQNMRVVAAEEEVASVWIGGFDENVVNEQFSVPNGKKSLSIVLFAYTDDPVYVEQRFGMNEVCFYDEYSNQINSFWDEPGWRGVREESRIQKKRARSVMGLFRRKLKQLL